MDYLKLRLLKDLPCFTSKDLSYLFKLKPESALVQLSRYVKKGIFIRLKKDLYILRERWDSNHATDFYKIANILQVPSYISLTTALSFYEVTTQVQIKYFESVCQKRTARYEIEGAIFNFYKIKPDLYFDFVKIPQGDFFIATKEKAFLDALYLYSFGKYTFDIDSIDFSKLDLKRIKKLIKVFPERTQATFRKLCKT
ncbi:type IV toxin-antitoxin system AbiEi family antitoxin domain-containing protein [Thermodesulfobacterium hveragerdense]|uniref:type IV toxin-antitoxin system AbiEi family antitoxin domain-containing protein n=1 Tax=Thermodesulfobacterium hveragerdense TaxID=53424 RepID=UPI000420F779|nr:hypothetical protein [Thermodesulfobacterium hveragerdense]